MSIASKTRATVIQWPALSCTPKVTDTLARSRGPPCLSTGPLPTTRVALTARLSEIPRIRSSQRRAPISHAWSDQDWKQIENADAGSPKHVENRFEAMNNLQWVSAALSKLRSTFTSCWFEKMSRSENTLVIVIIFLSPRENLFVSCERRIFPGGRFHLLPWLLLV